MPNHLKHVAVDVLSSFCNQAIRLVGEHGKSVLPLAGAAVHTYLVLDGVEFRVVDIHPPHATHVIPATRVVVCSSMTLEEAQAVDTDAVVAKDVQVNQWGVMGNVSAVDQAERDKQEREALRRAAAKRLVPKLTKVLQMMSGNDVNRYIIGRILTGCQHYMSTSCTLEQLASNVLWMIDAEVQLQRGPSTTEDLRSLSRDELQLLPKPYVHRHVVSDTTEDKVQDPDQADQDQDQVSDDCPICYEGYVNGDEIRFLSCLHRAHRACMDECLLTKGTCPICRQPPLASIARDRGPRPSHTGHDAAPPAAPANPEPAAPANPETKNERHLLDDDWEVVHAESKDALSGDWEGTTGTAGEQTIWHNMCIRWLLDDEGKGIILGYGQSQWRAQKRIPFVLLGSYDPDKAQRFKLIKMHALSYMIIREYQCAVDVERRLITIDAAGPGDRPIKGVLRQLRCWSTSPGSCRKWTTGPHDVHGLSTAPRCTYIPSHEEPHYGYATDPGCSSCGLASTPHLSMGRTEAVASSRSAAEPVAAAELVAAAVSGAVSGVSDVNLINTTDLVSHLDRQLWRLTGEALAFRCLTAPIISTARHGAASQPMLAMATSAPEHEDHFIIYGQLQGLQDHPERELRHFPLPEEAQVGCWATDSMLLLSTGMGNMRVLTMGDDDCLSMRASIHLHNEPVTALDVQEDDRLITCSDDRYIHYTDLKRMQILQELLVGRSTLTSLKWSPHSNLLGATFGPAFSIWDVRQTLRHPIAEINRLVSYHPALSDNMSRENAGIVCAVCAVNHHCALMHG